MPHPFYGNTDVHITFMFNLEGVGGREKGKGEGF